MESSKSTIPAYEATAVDDIAANVNAVRVTYRTNRTKDIQFRLVQLRKLYWGLVDNTPLIEEALMKDLRKSKHETTLTEIDWCKTDIMDTLKNLEKWAKDEPVVGLPLQFKMMKNRIRNEPLGVILVIGSFNFPIQLTLGPVIGAIAAGNCVVLKPSELSPNSAMVLKKIFDEYLDPECYTFVTGAVPETSALLEQKFDKIVFTGGKNVGKIIAKKAAETLTPVLLELGGQNPAFVTKNAKLKLAARRILWQKVTATGQLCLSHNYILVERSILSQFIGEMNKQYRVFMPQGAKSSPDYGRIVNLGHFNRLKKMLESSKGRIVMGGAMDESDLFIEPTMVLVDDINDSMMVEETFGPIWSIMVFDTLDQAIDIANRVDPTPLSLVTFGSDAENQKGKRADESTSRIPSLTHPSLTQCHLWRCYMQRLLHPRPNAPIATRRRRAIRHGRPLPRLLLLQGLQPPAYHCRNTLLGRRAPPGPLHALLHQGAEAFPVHGFREAQL